MNNRIEIESIHVDALVDRVADAVLDRIRPLLAKRSEPRSDHKCASRSEMAEILGWSIAKLDRRTSDGAIPSVMDEGRRTYIVDDVFAALREATPAAEAAARERQAAKQNAKRKAK